MFYFEVTIKNLGLRKLTTVGFSTAKFKDTLTKPLGGTKESWGIRTDGKMFHSNNDLSANVKFDKNDVLGAGIILRSRKIFFTKNGQ